MYHLKQDHTYSNVDLFKTFPVKKVKGIKGRGRISKKYNCSSNLTLARKIFIRFIYLLLQDITDGGTIFYFSSKHLSCIRMLRVSGDNFKRLRTKGFFRDVDFLISNFSGYFISMEYVNTTQRKIVKHIAISNNFREKITSKTNQGYRYC